MKAKKNVTRFVSILIRVTTILENLENLEKYDFFGNLRENLENSGNFAFFSLTQGKLREFFFLILFFALDVSVYA